MRITCLILICLISLTAKAQQINFRATIVDAQTNRPMHNTFISIRLKKMDYQAENSDKRFFYKADTSGKVEFTTNKITSTDTITLSCFNYETLHLTLKDVPSDHIIKLTPITKPEKYVADHSELFSVGSKQKSSKYYNTIIDPGYDNTMFMHGSQDIKGIIQTVGFYLTTGHGDTKGDVMAPFRIRIFKIDTAAAPGEELTKDLIITSATKNNAWCDVDISAYNIESPCEGFYVAFTLLDSGYYQIKKNAPTLYVDGKPFEYGAEPQNILSPRLTHTIDEFEMPRSYFSVNRSLIWSRHWEKDYENHSYMIRATILAPKYSK